MNRTLIFPQFRVLFSPCFSRWVLIRCLDLSLYKCIYFVSLSLARHKRLSTHPPRIMSRARSQTSHNGALFASNPGHYREPPAQKTQTNPETARAAGNAPAGRGERERDERKGFFSKERPGIWGEWSCRTDPLTGLMGLMGLMAAVGARLREWG